MSSTPDFINTEEFKRDVLETPYFKAVLYQLGNMETADDEAVADFILWFGDVLVLHSLASDPHIPYAYWTMTTDNDPVYVFYDEVRFSAAIQMRWKAVWSGCKSMPVDKKVPEFKSWHTMGSRLAKRYGMKSVSLLQVTIRPRTSYPRLRSWTLPEFGPMCAISLPVVKTILETYRVVVPNTFLSQCVRKVDVDKGTQTESEAQTATVSSTNRATSPTPPPGVNLTWAPPPLELLKPVPKKAVSTTTTTTTTISITAVGTQEAALPPPPKRGSLVWIDQTRLAQGRKRGRSFHNKPNRVHVFRDLGSVPVPKRLKTDHQ